MSDVLDNVPQHAAGQGKKKRSAWTQTALDEVAGWEAKGVQIEGYLLKIKEEGPEACNCGSATDHDFHMWIVESKTDDRDQAMVVEVSPRLRPGNPAWTKEALTTLATHKAKVRISGWLMWDQEHPEQLEPAANRPATRGTLWEIHPIHRIEVKTGGTWRALD